MVCYLPRFFYCSTDHYHTGCLKGKVSPNISLLVDIPHILIDNPKLRNIKVLVGLFHKIISPPTDCNIPALWSLNLNLSNKTHKFGLVWQENLKKNTSKSDKCTEGFCGKPVKAFLSQKMSFYSRKLENCMIHIFSQHTVAVLPFSHNDSSDSFSTQKEILTVQQFSQTRYIHQ